MFWFLITSIYWLYVVINLLKLLQYTWVKVKLVGGFGLWTNKSKQHQWLEGFFKTLSCWSPLPTTLHFIEAVTADRFSYGNDWKKLWTTKATRVSAGCFFFFLLAPQRCFCCNYPNLLSTTASPFNHTNHPPPLTITTCCLCCLS